MQDEPEIQSFTGKLSGRWQYVLDKLIPHTLSRWIAFSVSLYFYFVRVYLVNGWYVVTYGLGIYLLNQLLGFISPQFDPDDVDLDLGLPVSDKEEFRPFARKLPEFKFWHSCIKSVWIAFLMTFFTVFDVPVFWPILLIYFLILFVSQMRRQIRHMIKHRYVPFSWGKTKYKAGKAPSQTTGKQSL